MELGKQHQQGPQNSFPILARGLEGFNRNKSCLARTRTDIYVVLVMHIHKQAALVESGAGGGVSKCSPPTDFKLPATPRKH